MAGASALFVATIALCSEFDTSSARDRGSCCYHMCDRKPAATRCTSGCGGCWVVVRLPVGRRPSAAQLLALLPVVAVLVVRLVIRDQAEPGGGSGDIRAHWLQNLIRVPAFMLGGTTLGG